MESDLTLDQAIKLVRQHEALHEQQEILSKGPNTESKDLEEVRSYRVSGDKKRKPTFKRSKPRSQTALRSVNNCGRCGKRGAYSLVCRHGGSTQKEWIYPYMRRPEATKRKCYA